MSNSFTIHLPNANKCLFPPSHPGIPIYKGNGYFLETDVKLRKMWSKRGSPMKGPTEPVKSMPSLGGVFYGHQLC